MTREEFKSMSEWVDQHLAERAFARAARAMIRAGHPRADQSVPMPGIVELPANPTLEDVAKQLGVSVEEFQQATGGMSLDRLMQLLGVEDAGQLVEMLDAVIRNQPKGLNRFERVRVAVAKVRLYGRNCAKLMTIERARAARAEARKHSARAKARG